MGPEIVPVCAGCCSLEVVVRKSEQDNQFTGGGTESSCMISAAWKLFLKSL